jgi:hypothetical protein
VRDDDGFSLDITVSVLSRAKQEHRRVSVSPPARRQSH